jgi:lysophospholipase L1-like esterase
MMMRVSLLTFLGGCVCLCRPATAAEDRPPLVIMPLGDSITAGDHVGGGGYREYLRQELVAAGLRVDFVGRSTDKSDGIPDPEHEGYSGYTIGQIAAKADEALQQFRPDIILLFAGTNDIRVNGGNDRPDDPLYWRAAPQRFAALLEVIWRRSPEAWVLVGTLMPFAESMSVREPAAQEFNAALRGLVREAQGRGRRIDLVDFRRTVGAADLADGAHPNVNGYRKMARLWAEAIGAQRPGAAARAPKDATASPATARAAP